MDHVGLLLSKAFFECLSHSSVEWLPKVAIRKIQPSIAPLSYCSNIVYRTSLSTSSFFRLEQFEGGEDQKVQN